MNNNFNVIEEENINWEHYINNFGENNDNNNDDILQNIANIETNYQGIFKK